MPITDLVVAADGTATCKVVESESRFTQFWDGVVACVSKDKAPTSAEAGISFLGSNIINHVLSTLFGHIQASKGKNWYLHSLYKTPKPAAIGR